MHEKIKRLIEKHGGRIDAIYYCPDMPESNSPCRKPNTGMIDKARRDFDIDMSNSFVIGDDYNDMELARRISTRSIFLDRSGKNNAEIKSDYKARNFKEVLEIVAKATGLGLAKDANRKQ